MMIIIIISTIQLSIDNPLDNPNSLLQTVLMRLDYILTAFFAIEAILKIIASGLVFCGSTSYLRSYWNILDILVVTITILSYSVASDSLNAIKVFRLMKVMRPLRFISRNQGLRISIRSLGVAVGGIVDSVVVCVMFYFIFGIIGINYFKGGFYDCNTKDRGISPRQKIDTKWDCLDLGGDWDNSFLNFDHIGNAMTSLFIVFNGVQWSEIMYKATSIRGLDLTHSDSLESTIAALFFVFVMIIGNFFLQNLFIGVIITQYNREKELMGKDFMLTSEQKKWVKSRVMILQAQPKYKMKLPANEWRQPFFYIAQSEYVNHFFTVCIVLNTIVLLLEWYGQSDVVRSTLDYINYGFATIFTIEFLIKYIGFGNRYFRDGWNMFDVIIVLLTILSILIDTSSKLDLGPQTTIIRSFRIARIFYMLKRNRALKSTFMTFLVTLPSMANIGSLLGLIIFIYSILGVYLFAEVKFDQINLNEKVNFQTVGAGFLTLIRVATGEKWPLIMESLSRKNSPGFECIENPTYEDYVNNQFQTVGCGNQYLAIGYFFSYVLLIVMIFLRLFIAIVLQQFQETSEKDNKFMNSSLSDHFRDVWCKFDPDATGFIKAKSYRRFLNSLGDPLGWDISFEHNFLKQEEYLAEVHLPLYNSEKEYFFMDVFEHLILLMIIRREVIHFAIKNQLTHLLGSPIDHIQRLKTLIKENPNESLSSIKSEPNPLDRYSDSSSSKEEKESEPSDIFEDDQISDRETRERRKSAIIQQVNRRASQFIHIAEIAKQQISRQETRTKKIEMLNRTDEPINNYPPMIDEESKKPSFMSIEDQQKTISDLSIHRRYNLGGSIDLPEIDIVDEELNRIEFESLNKSTHIGSVVVPPLRLPLPKNDQKQTKQNNNSQSKQIPSRKEFTFKDRYKK